LVEVAVEAGSLKVVFMGTPEFAVPSLKALLDAGYEVVLVVTQPDRPAGRGRRITPPPVKEFAEKHGLRVIQPESLKSGDFLKLLKELSPDLIVVVAYGKLIPGEVLTIPKYGVLNVHASLLPKFRGSSPIQSALLSGERETGVTIMEVTEKLDSGPILLQESIPIGEDDNAGTLHKKLSTLGAALLVKAISGMVSGKLKPKPQDDSKATYCRKITKQMGRIDWSLDASSIVNMVRAFTPWPSAFTSFRGKLIKITDARAVDCPEGADPGTVISAGKGALVVKAGRGCVRVMRVKPEGRREMSAEEFINGYRVCPGDVLE